MNEVDIISKTMVRQMEALLTTIHQQPIKIMLVKQSVAVDIEIIKSLVCGSFDLSWKKVISHSRTKDVVYARMSCSYLCKEYTTLKDDVIAQFIDRDRTCVISNHKTIGSLYFTRDPLVYPFLNPIIQTLKHMLSEAEKVSNQNETPDGGRALQCDRNVADFAG